MTKYYFYQLKVSLKRKPIFLLYVALIQSYKVSAVVYQIILTDRHKLSYSVSS